jgi:outer membrane protein TolC
MKKILLIYLLFLQGLYANGLTLEESINKTLANHPDVKSFILKVEQAKENTTVALSDYKPQVNFQAGYDVLQTNILPIGNSNATGNGWNAGISMNRKIWDFSKTSSKIEASKVEEQIAKLSLGEAKALLVYKVKSLYAFLVVQTEAIVVREKDLETKKAYHLQAKALVKQGLKTDADASRFLSSVYIAQDNLAIAEASYKNTKITLALYMGEEVEDNLFLQSEVIKKEYYFSANIETEVLEHNYQLEMESQNIEKNRLLHKSEKASHYGSIDAYASYNKIESFFNYDSKFAGLTLAIPIYSGGRITALEQKAHIAVLVAQEAQFSKILVLKEEINGLLIDIRRYKKTIASKQAGLNAEYQAKRVLEARYKEGLSTYIEVLDATSSVLNSNLGLIEAYYFRTIAINRIEYLKGDLS